MSESEGGRKKKKKKRASEGDDNANNNEVEVAESVDSRQDAGMTRKMKKEKKAGKGINIDDTDSQKIQTAEVENTEALPLRIQRKGSEPLGGLKLEEMVLNPKRFGASKKKAETKKERAKVQAVFDMRSVKQLRMKAKRKRLEESLKKGNPVTFSREYYVRLCLNGVENMTDKAESAFFAFCLSNKMARIDPETANFFEDEYNYSKSYDIPSYKKKEIMPEMELYDRTVNGSYQWLKDTEIRIDMWNPSMITVNSFIGYGAKRFWELCRSDQVTTIDIKKYALDNKRENKKIIMVCSISCVFAETFIFTITLSNFQFMPLDKDFNGVVALKFEVPTMCKGEMADFKTEESDIWVFDDCGEFTYKGTVLAFELDYMVVTLIHGGSNLGGVIVPLTGVMENPAITGTVKANEMSEDGYNLGTLAGSIKIRQVSAGVPPECREDLKDPTVLRPEQPRNRALVYMLDPALQYLVVELYTAESLPIADTDSGTTNPVCKVTWDSMRQQSTTCECTTRPVWNQFMYFPAYFVNPDITSRPDLVESMLPLEMQLKGPLIVEVWHWNGTSASDLLGAVTIDLNRLSRFGVDKNRSIVNPAAKALKELDDDDSEDEDDDEEEGGDEEGEEGEDGPSATTKNRTVAAEGALSYGIHPDLLKVHRTRVYQVRKEPLKGSWFPGAGKAACSFDVYFVPDFPEEFLIPEWKPEDEDPFFAKTYDKAEDRWRKNFTQFQRAYNYYFIDAFPKTGTPRNFHFELKLAGTGTEHPLCNLLRPLQAPGPLQKMNDMMHWMACFNTSIGPKQEQKGQIDKWMPVSHALSARRGAPTEKACLLACLLLGKNKDAYVCVGTLHSRKEHAWVMVRNHDQSVTFYEPCAALAFHLPNRWAGDDEPGIIENLDEERKYDKKGWMKPVTDEAIHQLESQEPMVILRTRREAIERMAKFKGLPIAPKQDLLGSSTLVTLPYRSIETVFNDENVWGNMRHHDPGCITYDLLCEYDWFPLLQEEAEHELVNPIDNNLTIGPAFGPFEAEAMCDKVKVDIQEAMRFKRTRKGYETKFYDSVLLNDILDEFLDNLEAQCCLDNDYRVGRGGEPMPSAGTGFVGAAEDGRYADMAQQKWRDYWATFNKLESKTSAFPVPENHSLFGLPFHIASLDMRELRAYLTNSKELQEIYDNPDDEIELVIHVKLFGLLHSISSTWIFVGAILPMTSEECYVVAETSYRNQDAQNRAKKVAKAAMEGGSAGADAEMFE